MTSQIEKAHKALGCLLAIWYGAVRWTWFSDAKEYWWAYAPINLATAFASIVFLFTTITIQRYRAAWLVVLAHFLAFRNSYYAFEDIIDLPHNVPQQLIFIAIDVAMLVYCWLYLRLQRTYAD